MRGPARSLPRTRVPSLPAWPTLRRRLVIASVVLLALSGGYMLWLRNSSLVAVEQVSVEGAGGDSAIEESLRAVALEQSTLNVDVAALERAVSSDPAVRSVSADPDLPHALTISVDLREPVGWVKETGSVVAGDGIVLDHAGDRPDGVPAIDAEADRGGSAGGRIGGEALEVSRVLGAAPAELLAAVQSAALDPDLGVVVALDAGLELRFGGAGDAESKWMAAAAVLADPKFEGAAYLDLSVPDRPVAGGVAESPEEIADPLAPEPVVEAAPAPDPAVEEPVPAASAPAEPAAAPAEDAAASLADGGVPALE